MRLFENISAVYLIGIGGIGMSALARYFIGTGKDVYGYDRTGSSLTEALTEEGCHITYEDDIKYLPEIINEPSSRGRVLVIYTPAIPAENNILSWFRKNEYVLRKRAEILGDLSAATDTLAVSGTHGKTTVSTMLAHILRSSETGCSAFLGGISKNYNSNLILSKSRYTVMEADEFDRSFHRLSPLKAITTSVDADHLDIYGDHQTMIGAYNEFIARIRKGGTLLLHCNIRKKLRIPGGISAFTYGITGKADCIAERIKQSGDSYRFDLVTPSGMIRDLVFPFPGIINVENAVAASSMALMCGVREDELRKGLLTFRGVQRRFDIRINRPGLAYIDDYAHHPEEIRACISSVREFFGGRRITCIFQPHLFSRTRDHAEGFAEILDTLDEVLLLPVYPAREKPIAGISSSVILEKMKLKNRKLVAKEDIPGMLDLERVDVLLTVGAGDIDRLVSPIEEALKKQRKA